MRRLFSLLLALLLLAPALAFGEEELSPIPLITDFESRVQESMYDFSCRQRVKLADSLEIQTGEYWDEWFELPLAQILSQLLGSEPSKVVFFTCPNANQRLTNDVDMDILRSKILSTSLYATFPLNAFRAASIDIASIYEIWDSPLFHGAAFVVSVYEKDQPCVLTAFIEDGSGRAMTKTSLIYTEGAMDGNEFAPIAFTIGSQWEQEDFDICILELASFTGKE